MAAFTHKKALPMVLNLIRAVRSTLLASVYSFTTRSAATSMRDVQRRNIRVFAAHDLTAETGSFNSPPTAAVHNAENVLIARNTPALFAQCSAAWWRPWGEGAERPPVR
ncbi:hypothetical protein [Variovorax sp. YR266]|uniref:hypothetical protein n=1 Tax=Variovorax sp. YR266 TaxID=1884386 RepID=UPI000B876066|nr:hypothetical protein [Variovorax sp. YR266]